MVESVVPVVEPPIVEPRVVELPEVRPLRPRVVLGVPRVLLCVPVVVVWSVLMVPDAVLPV
jgi:hypothetical protein